MAALWNRAGHYILSCGFFFLFFYLSVFPRIISAVADWMSACHTSTHGVALVRIYHADLKHAARGSLKKYSTQNVAKKSPSGRHRTTLSGYIFATKARINNRKKAC